MVEPLLPAGLLDRLGALGRVADLETTNGGAANLTFYARLDDEAVAVKVAMQEGRRAGVRREARLLPLLLNAGLPVPRLLFVVDELDAWTFSVLGRIAGENGLELVRARPDAVEIVERARVLALVVRPAILVLR